MPRIVRSSTYIGTEAARGSLSWSYENGELVGRLEFRLRPGDRRQVQDLRLRLAAMAHRIAVERAASEGISYNEAYRDAYAKTWQRLLGTIESLKQQEGKKP